MTKISAPSLVILAALVTGLGILTIPGPKSTLAAADRGGHPSKDCETTDGGLANFAPVDPVQPPPTETFQADDGSALSLTDIARPGGAVVNFWATWCAPCIREMPQLDRLKTILEKDGITVIAISEDRAGLKKVKPFYAKQGYKNLDIHLDPKGRFARALAVRGLPTTILVDRKGRRVLRVLGTAEWDSPKVVKLIRACLAD